MSLHCPRCESTIVVDGTPPRDIVCTSCGSSIHLDPGATRGWLPDEAPKRLGKFEFLEELGIGSFGTVYKARDTELDRIVAVKIPRSGTIPKAEEMERFLREARSAAHLKHPGIVALYDAGTIDGTCCLVSEYILGATLGERLSGKRVSFHQAAELIAQVADALHYAHQHGIVHRDMKPSNIILDLEGRPHVLDFGLAKRAADDVTMTLDGQVIGTPAYMAPEQARGEVRHIDARSDVYGLGVILYQLITGELPFRGQTRMMVVQVLQDEPRPPRRLNDRIPRDLETICLKAMAKEPARRYQSACALAEDLRRFLKGEPIQARPVGQIERFRSWCRRNPLVASLTAAIALVLVAGATVATYFAIDATLERDRADAKAIEAENHARQARTEKERADRKAEEAEANAAEAHANLYIVRMKMIQLAWDNSNLALVRDLLDTVRRPRPGQKDLRGWEWHYFWRLCHQDALTIHPDADIPESVAFSPDGRRLLTGGEQAKIWDATTGKELLAFGYHGWVEASAFSPDGKRVATAGEGLRLWDSVSGKEHLQLKSPGHANAVAFSPDGTRLVSGHSDRYVRLWNVESGAELRTLSGHTDEVEGVAFSPDGRIVATGSKDRTVRLWDAADGRELRKLQGHEGRIYCVAFTPDGLRLASAGGSPDSTIRIWDTRTGEETLTLKGHISRVAGLAFSPDGRHLVSGSHDHTLRLWDATTGNELRTYKGHARSVYTVAYSPDGQRLATGSPDTTVRLWNVARSPEPRVLSAHRNQVRAVLFSGDGRLLVSAGQDGDVVLWDVVTGQEQRRMANTKSGHLGIAISSDGQRLATAGDAGTVRVWDLASGQNLWSMKGHPSWLSAVAFSPDGKWLASGGARNPLRRDEPILIKLWDASTGKEVRSFQGHKDEIKGLVFTPDGAKLISGSDDGTVKTWEVATGKELQTLKAHARGVTSIALNREGNLLASASADHTLKLWDLAAGKELRTFKGHFDVAWSVAFHPDGTRLASAGWDQTIRLWDIASGLELATLKGHPDRVLGVAFSPDGSRLASAGGKDMTVRLWDGRTMTADTHAEGEAVATLEFLFALPLRSADVIEHVRNSPSLGPQERQRAWALVNSFKEETDPRKYHDAAWVVIRHPHSNVFMCQFALAQTRAAFSLAPESPQYRIALGIAHYRLGKFHSERYADALATLTKCEQSQPATLAFLAMTQRHVGDRPQARITLGRLREAMKEPRWAGNEEAQAFLREATESIEGSAQ